MKDKVLQILTNLESNVVVIHYLKSNGDIYLEETKVENLHYRVSNNYDESFPGTKQTWKTHELHFTSDHKDFP